MRESSVGSGETARMLRLVWAFADKRCHKPLILCMCESSEGAQWHDCKHTKSRLSIDFKNAIYTPILYMCESSRGSWKTAHTLRLVWAYTEGICRMYAQFAHVREQWTLWLDCMHTKSRLNIDWQNIPYLRPFCACARAVEALARLHTRLGSSEHWLKEYAVCMPILRMCESSEGSGEAARMLRLVWALTDKRNHRHTHFVYVREQWRLWQDCKLTKSPLSIDWKNCNIYAHFVHVREQ